MGSIEILLSKKNYISYLIKVAYIYMISKFQILSSKFQDFILDLFFPKSCVACSVPDTFLCNECLIRIKTNVPSVCVMCDKESAGFVVHEKCQDQSALNGLFYIGWFSDPILRAVIKSWKYDFLRDLERDIGNLITTFVLSHKNIFPKDSIVTSIPLHPKRQAWRGFNQAEEIAKILSSVLEVLSENLLVRFKNTAPQAKLEGAEKQDNVRGVFDCPNPEIVRGRTVIITDDCFTTGATMGEAATALKRAGAKEVWGFVLAKG